MATEYDSISGRWAYRNVVVTAPRRAGKSFLIKAVTAHRCGTRPTSAWITAQGLQHAENRWEDVVSETPKKKGLLSTVLAPGLSARYGNGHRRLSWLANGSTFQPFTPNEQGMHGEDPDLVWVDELQAFSLKDGLVLQQGFGPALGLNGGQAWLLSTAGDQDSQWLNQLRRQGRESVASGDPGGTAFFEWSAPLDDGAVDVADLPVDRLVDLVYEAHPRTDQVVPDGYEWVDFRADADAWPRPEFVRAYGNITQVDEDQQGAFTNAQMEAAKSGARIADDARVALGVSVDPDRRESSIGIAVRDGLGVAVTDEKRAEGTRWVAGQVIGLVDRYDVATVAVANAGPARSVADELERAGVPLLRLSQADYAAACAGFADEFTTERPSVTWNGSTDFARAVTAAEGKRRTSGQVWESRTGWPITPLEARTLAVWAHDHAPKPEPRIAPRIW